MNRVCRPRSFLRLCHWPALVHPLLALSLLGSGCAAGSAAPPDESATPASRGTSNVSSSSSPAADVATPASSNRNGTSSSPVSSSASEVSALSALAPSSGGAAPSGEDDDLDEDEDDLDEDDLDEDDLDDEDDEDDDLDVDDDDDDDDDDDADDDLEDEDDDDDDANDGDDADDDDLDEDVTPPPPGAGTPDPSAAPVTFTSDIRAILVENCGRCHASGGLPAFASANADTAFAVAVSERSSIVEEITEGNMPADTCNGGAPGSVGCVSTEDLALIRAWIAAGTPE